MIFWGKSGAYLLVLNNNNSINRISEVQLNFQKKDIFSRPWSMVNGHKYLFAYKIKFEDFFTKVALEG